LTETSFAAPKKTIPYLGKYNGCKGYVNYELEK
jgi:hypothetical protein